MNDRMIDIAKAGSIVVMAGAGVSAERPTALPGWYATQKAIVDVLADRLETALGRPGWLKSHVILTIDTNRQDERFPPDYQAQLIEEMCGSRYFRALQAFDVNVLNASHDGIAALAASGAVRAVVTTNFDRLIERALDRRGIEYVVAYDESGYGTMAAKLASKSYRPLPLIKIHGTASDYSSMIDTLKQRKKGRAQALSHSLEHLHSSYWLYLGFSAADLETDRGYLGLVEGTSYSLGATYISYPEGLGLGAGAEALMAAYGNRGEVVVEYVPAYLAQLCETLNITDFSTNLDDSSTGREQFDIKLRTWSDNLSVAAAGLCLAAILEAVGQSELAIRILDRLVRKELLYERETDDYRALQLHYGRLGAAWGRFISVPDIHGATSNISFETVQSLLRLRDHTYAFAAQGWLMCAFLWLNRGDDATVRAVQMISQFHENAWRPLQPQAREDVVDVWLSTVQVFIVNSPSIAIEVVNDTAQAAINLAQSCGDVVRKARVVALWTLALGVTDIDVPEIIEKHMSTFGEVERVGDGFALGMRTLALGRWHVGPGGLELVQEIGYKEVSQRALEYLAQAVGYLGNQGMDPWILYALIQRAKAFADLRQFDEAQSNIDMAWEATSRFPIMKSHVLEAVGQVRQMHGNEAASQSFRAAIQAAKDSGLFARAEFLSRNL